MSTQSEKFRSRKFALAAGFSMAAIAGLFVDQLSGGEFLGAIGVILGLYGPANVAAKWVERNAG